ncbi:RHS repeat-associated core domain-containing protein [Microbulbifer sp. ZKSA002]|uniref:RHS repeat-associated core domain-containing protein n=1 Tax=Microbulbifer sp. ZKSA002 TaxID=3243388 RepID=UPI0040399890
MNYIKQVSVRTFCIFIFFAFSLFCAKILAADGRQVFIPISTGDITTIIPVLPSPSISSIEQVPQHIGSDIINFSWYPIKNAAYYQIEIYDENQTLRLISTTNLKYSLSGLPLGEANVSLLACNVNDQCGSAAYLGSFLSKERIVYTIPDTLGSPILEADQAGNVIQEFHFDPFGATESVKAEGVGFTGHLNDTDLNLVYMKARYYDSNLGRFYSTDPVSAQEYLTDGNLQGVNRYTYANNNPYKYRDPNGELAFLIPVIVFVAKEVAAEAASRATGGATDFLSVRRMGTKFVKYGGKIVKSHSGSSPSKRLGRSLTELDGPRPPGGHQAAHIIPTGGFSNRSKQVQNAIIFAQKKFDQLLGEDFRDTALNGFWAKAGHNGTHSDKFFLELRSSLSNVKTEEQMVQALQELAKKIDEGKFQ